MKRPLRIAFLHPDLGIGGAERLVVDAARQLQSRGHHVVIYTAHHDATRSFVTTRDGTLSVHVRGDFFPMHVAGRLRAPCAIVRTALAATALTSARQPPDVVFCDLVAHVIPLVRLITRAPVVFYCHFPDRLLTHSSPLKNPRVSESEQFFVGSRSETGSKAVAFAEDFATQSPAEKGRSQVAGVFQRAAERRFPYSLYRAPIDGWEAFSTGMADRVLVNSHFTAGVFRHTFPRLSGPEPDVVYPGVDVESIDSQAASERQAGPNDPITILSINRYERAKNVRLAVDALALLRANLPAATFARLRLLVVGGYDERIAGNRETLGELEAQVGRLGLREHVELRRSVSDRERHHLLAGARVVVHTAENEHFGYVPVEAMAVGCPVVAVASGGVTETVRHGETGLLCAPLPEAFAAALGRLTRDPDQADRMGRMGREHVARRFSLDAFGERLERILLDVVAGRQTAE